MQPHPRAAATLLGAAPPCPAVRLDQLLAAGDWAAAHALLCDVVAPRWLLAGDDGRLAAVLAALEPHAGEVNLAGGAGAWEAGGGAYSAFLYLRDLYCSLGRTSRTSGAPGGQQAAAAPPPLSFQERMDAAARLAAMLADAAARWGLAGADAGGERRLDARPGGGAAQQAAYARMSGAPAGPCPFAVRLGAPNGSRLPAVLACLCCWAWRQR